MVVRWPALVLLQINSESQQVAIDALKNSIPGEIASAVAAIHNEQQTQTSLGDPGFLDKLRQSAEADYQAGRLRQLDLVNLESDLLNRQELQLASALRLNLAVAALTMPWAVGSVTPSFTLPAPAR